MVRERGLGPKGRHDGSEYWTLPGGGIDPDEDMEVALVREVLEEVGLECVSWTYAFEYLYPSGRTSCFSVEVAPGEPRLGEDPLECDCPRMVGLAWMPVPIGITSELGTPIPLMFLSLPDEPKAE
jgi:8-oxo-dGTP diphosphatase